MGKVAKAATVLKRFFTTNVPEDLTTANWCKRDQGSCSTNIFKKVSIKLRIGGRKEKSSLFSDLWDLPAIFSKYLPFANFTCHSQISGLNL
jgi:hypothetical protein